VLEHFVVVVHATCLVAGLATLADAHHEAAFFAQPGHQRREVGVRRGDDDHLRALGQREVDRVDGERDVGGVLARSQVDHGPDAQALERALVLDRRLGGAVGTPDVRAAVVLGDPGHGLLDHIERDVVGVDQQHHLVLGHGGLLVRGRGGRNAPGRQAVRSSCQRKVSPPRKGLIDASPKASVSGTVQGVRRSVTVPAFRGRP
jgi:hypothetical protein